MRRKAATVLVSLPALAATPAALAKGSVSIDGRIVATLKTAPAQVALAGKDRLHSCQAGASKARVHTANETQRKASTVACEQPPRSQVNLSGGLKAAEA